MGVSWPAQTKPSVSAISAVAQNLAKQARADQSSKVMDDILTKNHLTNHETQILEKFAL